MQSFDILTFVSYQQNELIVHNSDKPGIFLYINIYFHFCNIDPLMVLLNPIKLMNEYFNMALYFKYNLYV